MVDPIIVLKLDIEAGVKINVPNNGRMLVLTMTNNITAGTALTLHEFPGNTNYQVPVGKKTIVLADKLQDVVDMSITHTPLADSIAGETVVVPTSETPTATQWWGTGPREVPALEFINARATGGIGTGPSSVICLEIDA